MGVCTHEEVYPTNEVLSSSSELEMSTTGTARDTGKGLTHSSGSLGCGNSRLTIEIICGGSEYGTGHAGALCTGVWGDAGVWDDAADWREGVVEEDVTDNMAGDNCCAEGQDGVDLVCDDNGVACWVQAWGRDCPTGASLLLLCTLPAQAVVPPLTISCPNDVTLTYVDMPKGRSCDHKWQVKEGWIRAVALLRLWGCDNGVSNDSLLAWQRGVSEGREGVEQYTNYSSYGNLIDDRNDRYEGSEVRILLS